MFLLHLGGFAARIKTASIQRARRSVLGFQWSAQHGAVRGWNKATIRFNHAGCIMLLSLHRLHPAGRVRSATLPKVNYKLGYRASRRWQMRASLFVSCLTQHPRSSPVNMHEKMRGKKEAVLIGCYVVGIWRRVSILTGSNEQSPFTHITSLWSADAEGCFSFILLIHAVTFT